LKICLLTNNPNTFDDRIYYKLARSIKKIGSVYIINPFIPSQCYDGINIVGNNKTPKLNNNSWIINKLKLINPNIIQVTEPFLLPAAVKYKSTKDVKIIYDPAEDWASMYMNFSKKPKPIPQLLGFLTRLYENWYLSYADFFIASDDWLFQYYSNIGPCSLIYNYPNRDIFDISFNNINKRSRSCVYHGQLRKERGLFLMIKAMRLVVKKFPSAHLDLIGSFSYDSEKELSYNLVKQYHLDENINFFEPVSHLDIPGKIAQSTIGLIPFYDIKKFRRNIAIKMFEYNACKLPIVSSDLPPSKKHMKDVSCGICIKPNSYHDLADGIIQMFNNEKKLSLYGENGYNAFINQNYWEAQEERLFDIYKVLIKK